MAKTTSEIVGIYLGWLQKKGVKGIKKPMTLKQIIDKVADTMLKDKVITDGVQDIQNSVL